jgi:hypothetical protein
MDQEYRSPAGLDLVLRRMIVERQAGIAALEQAVAAAAIVISARDQAIAQREAIMAEQAALIEAQERQLAGQRGMIAECDTLIATQSAHNIAQDLISASQATTIAALTIEAARLPAVAVTLQWPDGPRAIQAVLPIARIIRRLARR